jgi:hypothetical protein
MTNQMMTTQQQLVLLQQQQRAVRVAAVGSGSGLPAG